MLHRAANAEEPKAVVCDGEAQPEGALWLLILQVHAGELAHTTPCD